MKLRKNSSVNLLIKLSINFLEEYGKNMMIINYQSRLY
jgi:hypothetical protein